MNEEIRLIKTQLETINQQLQQEIMEYIKKGDIDQSRKIRQIKNKNIETLLTIKEMEYKDIL